MTTIAYKDGILAGDSQMTRGDEKCIGVQKVFKTAHFLVGFAGSFSNVMPVYRWLTEYERHVTDPAQMYLEWHTVPEYGDGYSLLLVDRAGGIWTAGKNNPPVYVPGGFDATGSGSEFALGAMAAGASAPEAVAIAAKYDIYTGGLVNHVQF